MHLKKKIKIEEFKVFALYLALPSLPFSRAVFRLGTLESIGDVQKLFFLLWVLSVRPMPRATGNLILIFFCCYGFPGRSGWACPGVGSMFEVLPR